MSKSLLVTIRNPDGGQISLRFGPKSGKLKRNSTCFCGSGRKYGICCLPEFKKKGKRLRLPKALLPIIALRPFIDLPNP